MTNDTNTSLDLSEEQLQNITGAYDPNCPTCQMRLGEAQKLITIEQKQVTRVATGGQFSKGIHGTPGQDDASRAVATQDVFAAPRKLQDSAKLLRDVLNHPNHAAKMI